LSQILYCASCKDNLENGDKAIVFHGVLICEDCIGWEMPNSVNFMSFFRE